MTLADGIILGVVACIIGFILYHQFKKKDEGICARCSYAKSCSKEECFPHQSKKNNKERFNN